MAPHSSSHMHTGQFFLGGLSHLCPKIFDSARKTAMLTCKITLAHSSHPVTSNILVKILDFGHFISLDRMNSVFSFHKYKKIFFVTFGCWFLPENLAFARKIMVLPESGPQPPGLYAYGSRWSGDRRCLCHCDVSTNYCIAVNC